MNIDRRENYVEMNIKEILDVLPHRYPFLLVDKVLDVDLENGSVLAQKNLTMNEAFFQGHFPGAPIMPGVLILEALAQAGAILMYKKAGMDQIAVLLSIKNAKFRNPVHPGDILYLKGEGLHLSSRAGRIHAKAIVNEKIAVEAEIGFALVDKSKI